MFAGGNAVKRLGLQQRRHPVAGHIEAVAAQLGDFVLAGLIPGQQHVEQIAVDHDVFEIDRRAGSKFSRQTGRKRGTRFRGAGADGADELVVRPQLDAARDQVKGALVGVAFLEQDPSRSEVTNVGLAGERMQVFRLQPIEGRKGPENRKIERSFIHREFAAAYGFNPMILAANPTICDGRSGGTLGHKSCQPGSGRKRSP